MLVVLIIFIVVERFAWKNDEHYSELARVATMTAANKKKKSIQQPSLAWAHHKTAENTQSMVTTPLSASFLSTWSLSHVRPNLVLHIGPGKMGTTTLHTAFQKNASLQHLRLDNYLYRGKHEGPLSIFIKDVLDCPNDAYFNESIACPLSNNFTEFLKNRLASGNNLFLLNEMFASHNPQKLAEAVNGHWEVKIIVSYRRLHDLLPSMYVQDQRFERNASGAFPRKNWPDQGGTKIPTFSQWYNQRRAIEGEIIHPTIKARDIYKKYFKDISFFHIHKKGDLVSNFACDMLPGANHTCTFFKSSGLGKLVDYASLSPDYDRLAVDAYEGNLIRRDLSRQYVAHRVRFFQAKRRKKDAANDFPLICLDEASQKQLVARSLESERAIFPDQWSAAAEPSDLQREFDQLVGSKKFCHADTAQVLQDPSWISFFRSLTPLPE